MSTAIVQVDGLSVSYGRKRVLTNIHLQLQEGNIYGLIGPNGAGKSTLIKAILGLIEPNSGRITIQGDALDEQRQRMVYVPQKSEVDWSFPATVRDIVEMGRYPHRKLWQRLTETDHQLTDEALQKVGIADLANRQIGALSGGQQQRVFLARALAQGADIFFLDEPFVGVDITTEEKIVQLLKELADQGKTLVVVHHDLSTVAEYFDHVILLNQRLVAYGPTETTFSPENVKLAYGGQLPILHQTGGLE